MPNRLSVLFVLLLLSGLLLAAAGAQGASAGPVASTSAFEEDFENLEDELEEEEEESEEEAMEAECETAREEAGEGELGLDEVDQICAEAAEAGKRKKNVGKKKADSGSVAPEECVLRSTHTHAAFNGDKLKLTIGYTAYEPVGATVEVRKGSNRIASMRRRLGRSGVLRIFKNLGDAEAPKRVVVRLAAPTSPGYCGKYETETIRVR